MESSYLDPPACIASDDATRLLGVFHFQPEENFHRRSNFAYAFGSFGDAPPEAYSPLLETASLCDFDQPGEDI